jgi:HEAT repeat protein
MARLGMLGPVLLLAFELMAGSECSAQGQDKTISEWIRALRDDDVGIRGQATIALEKLGPGAKAAVPALIEALKDKEWVIRSTAASALRSVGKDAVLQLRQALKRKQELVRIGAACVLAETAFSLRSSVLPSADNDYVEIRKESAAAMALMSQVTKEAVPILIEVSGL